MAPNCIQDSHQTQKTARSTWARRLLRLAPMTHHSQLTSRMNWQCRWSQCHIQWGPRWHRTSESELEGSEMRIRSCCRNNLEIPQQRIRAFQLYLHQKLLAPHCKQRSIRLTCHQLKQGLDIHNNQWNWLEQYSKICIFAFFIRQSLLLRLLTAADILFWKTFNHQWIE